MKVREHMDEVWSEGSRLLDLGCSIIPVAFDTKVALAPWADYQKVAVSPEQWDDWCQHGAPCKKGRVAPFNVALVTGALSGVVVIDCDDYSAEKRVREMGLASPISVKTRKGRHFYFRHPGGYVQGGVNVLGFKIDIRGDGGIVVAPPSKWLKDGAAGCYEWEMGCDWDEMPVLPDLTPYKEAARNGYVQPNSSGGLDLTGVGLLRQGPRSVTSDTEERVAQNGLLTEGDGRNQTLVRFAGEQLRQGVVGDDLIKACEEFQARFFRDWLEDKEISTICKSVTNTEKRRKPELYDATGARIVVKPFESASLLAGISKSNVADEYARIGDTQWIMEPVLAHPSVVQVHGHSGAGKSRVVSAMLWQASSGFDFGPFSAVRPCKVLYIDYDNGKQTMVRRMHLLAEAYPSGGDGMTMISADDYDGLSLRDPKNIKLVKDAIKSGGIDVLVIDTVRQAWPGFDESKSWAWMPINDFCKEMRAEGVSVIMVHHSNKPDQLGLGREAGSTAQLNVVDYQMQVVSILGGAEGLLDEEERSSMIARLQIEARAKGAIVDEYGFKRLRDIATSEGHSAISPVMLKTGKTRLMSPLMGDHYLAWTEKGRTVSTKNLRQQAPVI